MTTPQPEIERRLAALFDAIDEPVSIARAIRDRDGRILDFRIEFMNAAAGDWAGAPPASMIGLITGELLPEFRASGYFDVLREVVETGVPFVHSSLPFEDRVMGGAWVGGLYELRAIRLGDGFLSIWRRHSATPGPR